MVFYFQKQQHIRVAIQRFLWYIMKIEVISIYVHKECLKSLKQGITAL